MRPFRQLKKHLSPPHRLTQATQDDDRNQFPSFRGFLLLLNNKRNVRRAFYQEVSGTEKKQKHNQKDSRIIFLRWKKFVQ